MKNKTVCLNMIVKNESAVIRRCLESMKHFIDYWVIVDTGSTDGTQKIILDTLKEIPGKLYERPWVDFATNRNEALQLAKNSGDYYLFIDADEKLMVTKSFSKKSLEKDFYTGACNYGSFVRERLLLASQQIDWKWCGVIHEAILTSPSNTSEFLEEIFIEASFLDGARSKNIKEKYQRDAQVLENALEKNPNDSRYQFHLALTYDSLDQYETALKNYQKRIQLSGNEKEHYFSLYRIGVMQEKLDMPSDVFIKSYMDAYQFNPKRIEPLYCLANYYLNRNSYLLAYVIAKYCKTIGKELDLFLCDLGIYTYGLLNLIAESSFGLEKYQEARDALIELLQIPNLPSDMKTVSEKNLAQCRRRLRLS